ncbi:hypothetical protein T12_4088 [Trichinella patagoniensis]|uniref:Uncharacterized protein n=1 Tax=Trichinella patagoniensis TaxID=990121 RepID=A0A0V0ZM59_9BILA|nr:hypothetical protein T12_4088 [Trichinella patagoniensis]
MTAPINIAIVSGNGSSRSTALGTCNRPCNRDANDLWYLGNEHRPSTRPPEIACITAHKPCMKKQTMMQLRYTSPNCLSLTSLTKNAPLLHLN